MTAFQRLNDRQLALNGTHDLPNPVEHVLNPLETPQQAKEAQVGRHGLSIDDGGQRLLHVIPQGKHIPACQQVNLFSGQLDCTVTRWSNSQCYMSFLAASKMYPAMSRCSGEIDAICLILTPPFGQPRPFLIATL